MHFLIFLPFLIQIAVITFDEFYFHIRRGLPKWERWGHPLDTLTVLCCFGFLIFVPYSALSLKFYIALAVFSCIFVTKDEFVHKECCPASEQWLHALLFLNHPIVLTSAGLLWPLLHGIPSPHWLSPLFPYASEIKFLLLSQIAAVTLFFLYQIFYWNFFRKDLPMTLQLQGVNNAFYDHLGESWYSEDAHPIALLRAENSARNPWVLEKVSALTSSCPLAILDIGCGAGFLTNALATAGHRVTGIDVSAQSLEIAKKRDLSQSVSYLQKDASHLDFPHQSFDVICAMDFLEHIEAPQQMIQQASKLLKPGGLFFFHTFNRNFLSWLVVIKGVEWLVPNTPSNMHVYSYFIKPSELKKWCEECGLQMKEMQGLSPQVLSKGFWMSLLQRRVNEDFAFKFTSHLYTGYLGIAQKK